MLDHPCRMTIGRRIAEIRGARGWSQQRLADAIGASQTTVSGWERSRSVPSRDQVQRIAAQLGVDPADIENGGGGELAAPATQSIPILAWVSAGSLADAHPSDLDMVHERRIVAGLPPGDYFETEVRGDSMDRISPEGSRVIVNIRERVPRPGKAYIFSLRGETTFKFFQREPVPRLEPHSTNPANKTIFLDRDPSWSVVGRVVRSYIDLA